MRRAARFGCYRLRGGTDGEGLRFEARAHTTGSAKMMQVGSQTIADIERGGRAMRRQPLAGSDARLWRALRCQNMLARGTGDLRHPFLVLQQKEASRSVAQVARPQAQAKMPRTTLPYTSVRRKSRPAWR